MSAETIRVNGTPWPLGSGRLGDLIRARGHDPEQPGIAIAVNGQVVPRGDWSTRSVVAGDEVEIVGAVQGG